MRENRIGGGAVDFVCRKVRDKTIKVRGDVGVWVGTSHAPAINVFCVNRPNQPDLSLGVGLRNSFGRWTKVVCAKSVTLL